MAVNQQTSEVTPSVEVNLPSWHINELRGFASLTRSKFNQEVFALVTRDDHLAVGVIEDTAPQNRPGAYQPDFGFLFKEARKMDPELRVGGWFHSHTVGTEGAENERGHQPVPGMNDLKVSDYLCQVSRSSPDLKINGRKILMPIVSKGIRPEDPLEMALWVYDSLSKSAKYVEPADFLVEGGTLREVNMRYFVMPEGGRKTVDMNPDFSIDLNDQEEVTILSDDSNDQRIGEIREEIQAASRSVTPGFSAQDIETEANTQEIERIMTEQAVSVKQTFSQKVTSFFKRIGILPR